jgi:hypothetical protein
MMPETSKQLLYRSFILRLSYKTMVFTFTKLQFLISFFLLLGPSQTYKARGDGRRREV